MICRQIGADSSSSTTGREIDVHVRVPLPDVALHDGKVVRLDSQDASAACNIVPAADDLHAIASIRP